MADPATQFQPASLQASGYTPVTGGNLGGSHLFGGAGALWAQVGKTALEAGEAIQKSALNPAVREQMKYSIDQYKRAEELIAKQREMGGWGYLLGTTGPGGYSQIAPGQITDPTLAQQYLNRLISGYPSAGGGGTGPAPAVNRPDTGEGGGSETQPAPSVMGAPPGTFFNPATGSFEKLQQPEQPPEKKPEEKKEKKPPTTKEMGGGTVQVTPGTFLNPATTNMFAVASGTPSVPSPTDFQGPTQAQTDVAVQESLARNRFASTGAGIPAGYQPPSGYFLNPATGSYEQLQQQQPQAQQQRSQDQDQTPLGKQLMAQWQNQNAHPVAPVSEALKWGKNNFDTRIQDATYLPHGGPMNQPAYAFHMKGGGTNLVPLSQMVRNGFAPNVAGNQTSMTLSQAEAMQPQPDQGQMQPTGAVGGQAPALQQGQGAQPVTQIQPTGNVGQPQPPAAPGAAPGAIAGGVAGVPAAPGGQELRDIYGNPLSAYTNVPSRGGPAVSQVTASTEGAGQPATPPRPLWEAVPQADQDTIQSQANAIPKDTGKYTGDPIVPNTPGAYTYYVDNDPDSPSRGRVYTVLPGKAGEYFNQQRWYLGRTEYDSYELPDSKLRSDVANYWIPTGEGPSREQINHMPPDELRLWARQAWINNNTTRGPADAGTNLTFDTVEQYHKSLAKMRDILQTLDKDGVRASSMDLLGAKAKNAAVASGLSWLVPNMKENTAAALRDLDEESNRAQALVRNNPNLLLNPGQAEGLSVPDIKAFGFDIPWPSVPGSNAIQDAAFSGRSIGLRVKDLNALIKATDDRYQSLVGTAQDNWQRVDPKHINNIAMAKTGKDLRDESNQYRDHNYPSEFPVISKEDYPAWAKAHPHTPFTTPDGRNLVTP
jgi:hypothetical protein